MIIFRKELFMLLVGALLLGSCSGSHGAPGKRRKPAPCDCPKFNYLLPVEIGRTYTVTV
jgi:hypothetical protein